MKKLMAIAAMCAAFSAHATNKPDTPTQGGSANANSSASAGAVGVGVGLGVGIGGAGGRGGSGGAGGVGGQGGSVLGSGNSAATGGSVKSNNDNRSNASASNSGNNAQTSVGGDSYSSSYRAATSTAYAPTIAPTAPCMGSTSMGGQGMSFGVSIGSTWKDEGCDFREEVRTVAIVLNDQATAREMMCAKATYREARERQGNPCKGAAPAVAQAEETDEIKRYRLGLPPLAAR